jgi:hypothetical protein
VWVDFDRNQVTEKNNNPARTYPAVITRTSISFDRTLGGGATSRPVAHVTINRESGIMQAIGAEGFEAASYGPLECKRSSTPMPATRF